MAPGPILAPELIYLIVDKAWAITNDPDRAQILSNLALLSRPYWVRVNQLRFKTVDLHGTPDSPVVKLIHSLRDIIEADPQSESTGLASHIRSFKVRIGGRMVHYAYEIEGFECLSDGSLATIMKKLFKTTSSQERIGLEVPSDQQCTFTLQLNFKLDGDRSERACNWPSLPADFLSAFFKCLQNPSLTTLHISYMDQFPNSILRNSFIRHFAVDHGAPSPLVDRSFNGIEIVGYDQAVFLDSLCAQSQFPLLRLVDFSQSKSLTPRVALSRLKNFSTIILNNEDTLAAMKLIAEAPSLEVLTLDYTHASYTQTGFLDLRQSFSLRELNVTYDRANKFSKVNGDNTALHYMPKIFTQDILPPNLKHLNLTFSLYNDNIWTHPSDVFSKIDFCILDEFFSDHLFHSLSSISFGFNFSLVNSLYKSFDMKLFLRDAKAWFREQKPLPLLGARKDSLQLDIVICPQIIQQARRRLDEWYVL